jgi:hypothetical protein
MLTAVVRLVVVLMLWTVLAEGVVFTKGSYCKLDVLF